MIKIIRKTSLTHKLIAYVWINYVDLIPPPLTLNGDRQMNEKMRKNAITQIEQKVMPIPECGCWIWPDDEILNIDSLENTTERIIYDVYNGSLLDSQEITHTCHLSCCMNPKHLSVDIKKH